MTAPVAAGPLTGVRVIEVAALGPVPFAGMMLSDLGADVIRVDRPLSSEAPTTWEPELEVTKRGRRSVVLDLKHAQGRAAFLALVATADVLIEGNRPGVMERLGLGPVDCQGVREQLVYGRATGWGQDGPWAQEAGHDIDFLALTGVLWGTGRVSERPVAPLNLLGDYGGGGMLLAFGVLAAVLDARTSGIGQVVDAAMVDGVASMSSLVWEMRARGLHADERGVNLLDSGAPFYDVYACADGEYVCVGALEPKFYARLCELTGFEQDMPAASRAAQGDRSSWPGRKTAMEELFATRTRQEWSALLEGTESCFAPVLSWPEAAAHPHNTARSTFVDVEGVTQPAPSPRFSRTPGRIQRPAQRLGAQTDEVLTEAGFDGDAIDDLRRSGATT